MTQAVSPTLVSIFTKLKTLVESIVPTGTPVLRGPINRAALPAVPNVIMTPLFSDRLRTNQHTDADPYPSPGGQTKIEQGTKLSVQLDFYGPDSGEWATGVQLLWRDEYACIMLSPDASPLYTNDARMAPLVTGEAQYFERYILTVVLQWNAVTVIPQEFADAAVVVLVNVDEAYPP